MGVEVTIVHLCPTCLKTWREPERDEHGRQVEPRSRIYHAICVKCENPPKPDEFLDAMKKQDGKDEPADNTAVPPWKR